MSYPTDRKYTKEHEWISADGKIGFVAADTIAPLGGDQICYSKQGGDWKIAGYVGGASQ